MSTEWADPFQCFRVVQCVSVCSNACFEVRHICLPSEQIRFSVSVCFNVFQCVSVCCSARCSVLLRYDTYVCLVNSSVSLFSCVSVCCSVLQCVAVHFSVLQCALQCVIELQQICLPSEQICCSVFQCVAVRVAVFY